MFSESRAVLWDAKLQLQQQTTGCGHEVPSLCSVTGTINACPAFNVIPL